MRKRAKKLISVIIPTYNEKATITELISRLTTSLSSYPHELIFVDDHSSDGTYELLQQYTDGERISAYPKMGLQGKAYSLIEGFAKARGDIFVMIDSDLQYPPEDIVPMLEKLQSADIVIANRKSFKAPALRKIISRSFRTFFGKLLFGLPFDIQSGLKVFTREVYETVDPYPSSAWTFDLNFIYTSHHAGYKICGHDIVFEPRKEGKSKISFLRSSFEIGNNAFRTRFKQVSPLAVKRTATMRHAGIRYKKRSYVTHTTLHHTQSAIQTFYPQQKFFIGLALFALLIGFILYPLPSAQVVVAILSIIYFLDVLFNLYIILKSLHSPQEITVSDDELAHLSEKNLPIYSILCPLYKEAHVIPQFLASIDKLSWPKEKLDVLLLLEEDDRESIEAVKKMVLPSYVRMVVVPDSQPKTKPKACNYGLTVAKGKYLVIFDAEDMPDPLQLKKAYLAFQTVPKEVICLQAKLNYYNPEQNLLTRFFTAEYSLWFDVTLTGLQSLNTSLPLGGTSNHFRVADLKELEGWDPFNVTEDADLGVRLFKAGYKTAIIDSTTLEEANSRTKNWLRQRSRWIKGYMQTYLVHMRNLRSFVRTQGIHALYFQLTIGGKLAFILINPFLWLATFSYFALYAYVGPTIESLYPAWVLYMAVTSLIFGNFLFLYYYMIGCAKRDQWSLIKYVYLIPVYWLMTSVAGFVAFYQLLFKPHYWEKTIHGLHLKPNAPEFAPSVIVEPERAENTLPIPASYRTQLFRFFKEKRAALLSGGALVAANIVANVLNLAFNLLLGRGLSPKDFALLSLISSFLYLIRILFNSTSTVINYRSGFLDTRYGADIAYSFYSFIKRRSFYISLVASLLWIILIPWMTNFFHIRSYAPFLIFTFVCLTIFPYAVSYGYLSGKLYFSGLAILALVEPLSKLISVGIFEYLHLSNLSYASIIISIVTLFIIANVLISTKKKKLNFIKLTRKEKHFPKDFFFISFLSQLSSIAFLSLDIVLAQHFLPEAQAETYALISLVGKMVYFLGTLASPFIIPLVSRNEGSNKSSEKTLYYILGFTLLLTFAGFVVFGLFSSISITFLLGAKAHGILDYLPIYTYGIMCFTLSRVFVGYYLAKKEYSFTILSLVLSVLQIGVIHYYHEDLFAFVLVITLSGFLNLVTMTIVHFNIKRIKVIENNLADLFGLFEHKKEQKTISGKNILIFNWRDVKHAWAGGAETYIHEIAKRWVAAGNHVTLFCGNDGKHAKKQIIDGVEVIRHGGAYTVYLWACVYYLLHLRGKYDVIVDSENGIPFFSPLFSRKPVILLIHHIHQEVFRKHLIYPLAVIAEFSEAKLMPIVYRNSSILTVSESSRQEIKKLGLTDSAEVRIVNPGINHELFLHTKKTSYPSLMYLGRLRTYKNVDTAIRAFSSIVKKYPKARLSIVGEGESMKNLKKLVVSLGLENVVTFLGKVSDQEKVELLAKHWIVLQPSMIEGWGITVIEANASKTPVIASNVHGLRDSIIDGKTGILVPVKDAEELAKAVLLLIKQKKLRVKMSEEAYLWSQKFSWNVSSQKFLNILDAEIENRRKGSGQSSLSVLTEG